MSAQADTPERDAALLEALGYAARGWHIVPMHSSRNGVCSCGKGAGCRTPGKHPRISDWRNKATKDAGKIRSWFDQWPDANVGIVTGAKSGVVVLDVDPRNGGSLDKLKQRFGQDITNTLMQSTGGGGWHLFYDLPSGEFEWRSTLCEGVEVKANGCVNLPPSVTAGRYEWINKLECADLPPEVLAQATRREQRKSASSEGDKIPPGQRHDKLISFLGKGLPATTLGVPVLPLRVEIGGEPASVLFAGSAPGFAGLMQLNVRVPVDIPGGDDTSVSLSVGSSSNANSVTLAVR